MKPILQELLDHAFSSAPAREANLAIHRIREGEGGDGDKVRSFELIAPPEVDAGWLEKEVLPRLVYHLESLGIRPPAFKGMFISLFQGDTLYFIRTQDFMAVACQALRSSADDMYARWGTGEARHAISLTVPSSQGQTKANKEVLALPPGTD